MMYEDQYGSEMVVEEMEPGDQEEEEQEYGMEE